MGTSTPCCWGFSLDVLYRGRPTSSEALTAAFTLAEALQAVRAMNKNSAPGPDGFGPSFHATAWDQGKFYRRKK
jgi:hypothetical protein